MYASVRRYAVDPADAPAILKRINDGNIGSVIGAIPGCVGYYAIYAGDGVLATVSVFENKAGVDKSTEKAAEWVKANVASDFKINPPEITAGEVIAKA